MLLWIVLVILIIVVAMVIWKRGLPPTLERASNHIPDHDPGYHGGAASRGDEFELYMVRHGQVDESGNLNETGREQAAKTGEYLKQRLQKESDVVIYSSSTQSALDTAEIIREKLNTKPDVVQDERLTELDRGDGGKDFSKFPELGQKLRDVNLEFATKYPDPLDQHKHSEEYFKLLKKTFGGEDITARLVALRKLIDELRKHPHVIVVTHSGIINLLSPDLVSVSHKGSYLTGDVHNGRHCTITYYDEKDGKPVLLVPNNSAHLA